MESMSVRIRKARNLVAMSQAELARRIGVQRSAVTQWESPRGTLPNVGHLVSIAGQTNVNFEWIATGRGAQRCGDGRDACPAVMMDDYAADSYESRVLLTIRKLSGMRRKIAMELLETLAR